MALANSFQDLMNPNFVSFYDIQETFFNIAFLWEADTFESCFEKRRMQCESALLRRFRSSTRSVEIDRVLEICLLTHFHFWCS